MMQQQICLAGMLAAGLALTAAAQNPVPPAPPAPPRPRAMVHMRHGGGFLGVGVEEIDQERAQALGLREEHGVEVKSIEEGSPASKAGLKVGDVVLDYNGQRVEGVEQFTRMVGETPVGRRCTLGVWRNHAAQTLTATLAARSWPGFDEQAAREMERGMRDVEVQMKDLDGKLRRMPPMPPMSAMPEIPGVPPMLPRPTMGWQMSVLGIEGEELNPQLAEFFGVKEGVLVRSVVHDSPAQRGGLKAGDVITRIDGTVVTSPREIGSLMRASRGKQTTAVTLFRARKELTLEIKKSERSQRQAPDPAESPL